jgi:sialidase-1
MRAFSAVALACSVLAAMGASPGLPPPFDIDPTAAHPRSSEGSFASLKSGRILFCYSQFQGGGRDESPAAIAEIHSDDGGATWSDPRIVVPTGDNQNVMSVSLLRLHSGRLARFYLAKRTKWTACFPYVQYSDDEGATWSGAARVGTAPGYFEMNNDRAVQLSSGRILLPFSEYRIKGAADAQSSWDSRAIWLWKYSDDEGRTWQESDTWWAMPVVSRSGLQEPGVVELADGTVFSWSRTDAGAQYGSRSLDAGRTWSPPEPTELMSPESPASIKRLPGSGTLLAVYNDHSGFFTFGQPANRRTPLVIAYSADGGRTWPVRKELETDPSGWYCYTAIHFTPKGVLLAYCASDGSMPHLSRLRIRLVPWAWLPASPDRDKAEEAARRQRGAE